MAKWKKTSYGEKLLDPRWQRMRLKILERDGWSCRRCGETTVTLHVHHKRYAFGREPWDYSPTDLVTLCQECHQEEYESRKESEAILLELLATQGWWADEVHGLACDLATWGTDQVPSQHKAAFAWSADGRATREYVRHLHRTRAVLPPPPVASLDPQN